MSYWIGEYIKVLIAYLFTMYVWPSVVFYPFLKGKGKFFWFGFCTTVSVLVLSTGVLGLGLMHILHNWLTVLLFYGVFLVQLVRYFPLKSDVLHATKRLILGTMKAKSFVGYLIEEVVSGIKGIGHFLKKFTKGRVLEYAVLVLLILYGMLYFSWGPLHAHSYGFGDMYVHHSWVYGLKQGTVFYKGIYPEAMHTLIYILGVCFHIRIYSVVLYLEPVHTITLLIAMYLFLREVFRSRFGPHIALLVFLIIDVNCIDEIYGMSRLQWTLPQEFAMFTEFLGAAALLRYLRRKDTLFSKGWASRFYFNEDLFILSACIAASIAIHFYMTGMMFFLCVSIALWTLPKVFHVKRLIPLIVSVVAAVFIAILPMGIGYAEGIPFQGSIGWAMSIINGSDTKEGRTQAAQQEVESKREESETSEETTENNDQASLILAPTASITGASQSAVYEVHLLSTGSILGWIQNKLDLLYEYGYWTLYRGLRTEYIFKFYTWMGFISLAVHVLLKVMHLVFRKKRRPLKPDILDGYLMIITGSILFMILYAAPFLGLPELIAGSRLCSTEQFLICALVASPFDFGLSIIGKLFECRITQVISLAAMVFSGFQLTQMHMYHGYLYYEFTRYNQVVDLTNEIIDTYPKNTFTIISTTDELYQIIEYGFHEELVNFVNSIDLDYYTIPTPTLLVYVEKQPLVYAQYMFFNGPKWLAAEKYRFYYETALPKERLTLYPAVSHTVTSSLYAAMDTPTLELGSRAASSATGRAIMESQMEVWIKLFKQYYPHDISVFYEDESIICYSIRQNPARLTNLALFGE